MLQNFKALFDRRAYGIPFSIDARGFYILDTPNRGKQKFDSIFRMMDFAKKEAKILSLSTAH